MMPHVPSSSAEPTLAAQVLAQNIQQVPMPAAASKTSKPNNSPATVVTSADMFCSNSFQLVYHLLPLAIAS
jgi:hypothetical protein